MISDGGEMIFQKIFLATLTNNPYSHLISIPSLTNTTPTVTHSTTLAHSRLSHSATDSAWALSVLSNATRAARTASPCLRWPLTLRRTNDQRRKGYDEGRTDGRIGTIVNNVRSNHALLRLSRKGNLAARLPRRLSPATGKSCRKRG